MTDFISPVPVIYTGNDADRNVINAQALGESLLGASKLYTAVGHYCQFGVVPHGNYKKEFYCYAGVPKKGSYEYVLFLATTLHQYAVHGEIYKAALGLLVQNILKSIKDIWTKKSDTAKVVGQLSKVLRDTAKQNRKLP